MVVVYCATNDINGKVYIGFTRNTLDSRRREHGSNAHKKKPNGYFGKALSKYGMDSFSWEILYKSDNIHLLAKMERYFIRIYNSTDKEMGYNITSGGQGDYVLSEDYIALHLRGANNPFYGRVHTEATKQAIRDSNKRRSGENHHFWGKAHPRRGKPSEGIAILCVQTGERYISINSASAVIGISRQSISRSIIDGKPRLGYTFVRVYSSL